MQSKDSKFALSLHTYLICHFYNVLFYNMERPTAACGIYPHVEVMVWPPGCEPSQLIMKWAPPL